jgi:hypothetical protein
MGTGDIVAAVTVDGSAAVAEVAAAALHLLLPEAEIAPADECERIRLNNF